MAGRDSKYHLIDVWRCMKCNIEWMAPSVPHHPECPRCGVGGWWQRFAKQAELSEAKLKPVRLE